MQTAATVAEVREQVRAWKREGLTIGLVPTMGFLHEGHKSLIVRAAAENDRVVVSDFVNPTQFGPTEDLESYPRDFDRDCKLCEEAGAALVFHPEPSEMYAPNACTYVNMDELTHELCGFTRPIHFRGVCTVVSKLNFSDHGANRLGCFGADAGSGGRLFRAALYDRRLPVAQDPGSEGEDRYQGLRRGREGCEG